MKKLFTLLLVLSLPVIMLAQEEGQKFGIKFSGFISNDACFNTRQVVSARGEGLFILAPERIRLDAEGNDINAAPNFNFIGINSRLRGKISGPDAFGAKTSGMIEGDFFGTGAATKFSYRLRHAFMKLDWEKSQLLVGQYWHPTFVPECFPATVSFSSGVPFNPLARNPQFRYTYKLGKINVMAVAMARGHFLNKGAADSQKNAMVPEFNLSAQYKVENFVAGAGFGYQILKPNLYTEVVITPASSIADPVTGIITNTNAVTEKYVSDKTIGSMTAFGYAKVTLKPITVKVYGMYGQNNDNTVMMGGYAEKVQVTVMLLSPRDVEYVPYNTLSAWTDIHTNGKKIQGGIFAGYSQNLGAAENVNVDTFVGRWGDVQSMFRVAPRVVFISGKVRVGAEIEYATISYAKDYDNGDSGIDTKGVVTNYETADNIKFLLNFKYSF